MVLIPEHIKVFIPNTLERKPQTGFSEAFGSALCGPRAAPSVTALLPIEIGSKQELSTSEIQGPFFGYNILVF